ncbi:hypothetical protein DPV73_12830 [Leptospira mayottensis]|nr:hypothetical protein DPV73_12830 [Leptospira mayottensis]
MVIYSFCNRFGWAYDFKLLFPGLKNFIIFRNYNVLKTEIISLDKADANNTIKERLKRRNVGYRIPNKKMRKILNELLH